MSDRAIERAAEAPYTSLDGVREGLLRLVRELRARDDRRAVFATAYLHMTEALSAELEAGRFESREWMTAYTIRFAEAYRQALLGSERGHRAGVARAWSLAFDTAAARRGLVIQDLLLGLNAHINYDMPIALAETLPATGRDRCFADFCAALAVIGGVIDPIQDAIGGDFAPGLLLLDRAMLRVDEWATYLGIAASRLLAWRAALRMLERPGERARIREELDRGAFRLGSAALWVTRDDRVLAALRRVEALRLDRMPAHRRAHGFDRGGP